MHTTIHCVSRVRELSPYLPSCLLPFSIASHNYLYSSPFRPVYLRWPLSSEQVQFEQGIRRVGIGGLL